MICNNNDGFIYVIAQILPPNEEGLVPNPNENPMVPDAPIPNVQPGIQPDMQPQPEEQPEITPDLQIIKSIEDKFALANKYGLDLIMVYNQEQVDSKGIPTGRSKMTGPRSITLVNGEYAFENSNRGNELVRAWDEHPRVVDRDEISGKSYSRDMGEKTFKLRNIISLEFKPEDETILRDRKEIQ